MFKRKSFTLIEMIVTVGIIMILAAINFGVYYIYQGRTNLNRAAENVKQLVQHVQTLGLNPENGNVSHYILFLNINNTLTRTPGYQLNDYGPNNIDCGHLESNGGYCIVEVVDHNPYDSDSTAGNIDEADPQNLLNASIQTIATCNMGICSDQFRKAIERGRIDMGNAQFDVKNSSPLSGLQYYVDTQECNGTTQDSFQDCGYAPNCQSVTNYPGACGRINEDTLFKIHSRTWDGSLGINGGYHDLTSASTPDTATIAIKQGDITKNIVINAISGVVYIQ